MQSHMQSRSEEKVSGGKLLRVKVEFDGGIDGKISSVAITGDFFLYPEEKLKEIEQTLKGISTSITEDKLTELIIRVVDNHKIEMVGISPEAIARNIKKAICVKNE